MAAKTKIDVSLEALLETNAHLGHQSKRWNPKMSPYLYGVKAGVHIFDLEKTREALLEALEALKEAAKGGKVILLVGTKKQAKDKVEEIAKFLGIPYVSERWLGGTLTNFNQIQKSLKRLAEEKEKVSTDFYKDYTKKERLLIDRNIAKMEKNFGGISQLTALPDMLVVVDTHKESSAIREADTLQIKTIGLVDSNADPMVVDYPIPMNDDSREAIELFLDLVKSAIELGRKTKNGKKN